MGIAVINHVTLDGVMQGPGRPDEDRRGGFAFSGWASGGDDVEQPDPALGAAMGSVMGPSSSWLFGRRIYDDMVGHWNAVGGPFKDGLNAVDKYVVSRGTPADLPCPNSSLVTGDVTARLADLRERHEGHVVMMGSGELLRSLLLPLGWWTRSCSSCIRSSSAAGSVCSAGSAALILRWRRSRRHAVVACSHSTAPERRCVAVSWPRGRSRRTAPTRVVLGDQRKR